jgi:hypothetical protein
MTEESTVQICKLPAKFFGSRSKLRIRYDQERRGTIG